MASVKGFRGSIEDRLSEKLELAPNGCWLFTGMLHQNGYGRMRFEDKFEYTHRISWILHFGPIPLGMVVRHMCDERRCCNPDHLRIGTAKDNAQDRRRGALVWAFPLYHF